MSLFRNKSSEKLARAKRKEFSTKFADETVAELGASREKGEATDVVWNPASGRMEIVREPATQEADAVPAPAKPETAEERYERERESRNY